MIRIESVVEIQDLQSTSTVRPSNPPLLTLPEYPSKTSATMKPHWPKVNPLLKASLTFYRHSMAFLIQNLLVLLILSRSFFLDPWQKVTPGRTPPSPPPTFLILKSNFAPNPIPKIQNQQIQPTYPPERLHPRFFSSILVRSKKQGRTQNRELARQRRLKILLSRVNL